MDLRFDSIQINCWSSSSGSNIFSRFWIFVLLNHSSTQITHLNSILVHSNALIQTCKAELRFALMTDSAVHRSSIKHWTTLKLLNKKAWDWRHPWNPESETLLKRLQTGFVHVGINYMLESDICVFRYQPAIHTCPFPCISQIANTLKEIRLKHIKNTTKNKSIVNRKIAPYIVGMQAFLQPPLLNPDLPT